MCVDIATGHAVPRGADYGCKGMGVLLIVMGAVVLGIKNICLL